MNPVQNTCNRNFRVCLLLQRYRLDTNAQGRGRQNCREDIGPWYHVKCDSLDNNSHASSKDGGVRIPLRLNAGEKSAAS